MEKYRSRHHLIMIYPENEAHREAYERITSGNYKYAAILHDKDEYEDDGENHKKGDIKKEHWHIVLTYANATWSSAICQELGIEERFIEKAENLDRSLEYLVHLNDTKKYQYDVTEVSGDLAVRLADLVSKKTKTEGEKVGELLHYIYECEEHLTVSKFAKYCADNGYWSEFRRSASIFIRIIDEHNGKK